MSAIIAKRMALSWRALFLTVLFWALPATCIIFGTPMNTSFGNLTSNGQGRLTWIMEANDPSMVNLELQNNVTGDNFELAQHVSLYSGMTLFMLTDVSPGEDYFIQAVNISHHSHVYNSTALFNILEALPFSQTLTASSGGATVYYSYYSGPSTDLPTSTIAGIVIGTLILVALMIYIAIWWIRQRYVPKPPPKPEYPFPSISQYNYSPTTTTTSLPHGLPVSYQTRTATLTYQNTRMSANLITDSPEDMKRRMQELTDRVHQLEAAERLRRGASSEGALPDYSSRGDC
ncbi:hypothetical protein C8J56DRAFT_1156493 [Mycena floridula]|nr:hypothetical protein C8J56DRAFT_1156493 [Mycena floridula]